MKSYKPIHLKRDLGSVDKISSLFSNADEKPIKSDSNNFNLFLVPYSPDVYFDNDKEIGKLFEYGVFEPLVMTNYKFLSLLLVSYNNDLIEFCDFSLKNDNEYPEDTIEFIKDSVKDQRQVKPSFEFLQNQNQKISTLVFIFNENNKIYVYSTGKIGLSENFPQKYYNEVFKLVEFLFTGELND